MPTHRELANAIRFLAIDAIQKANSGHPGMPMGMADIAEVLWNGFLRFNPKNPQWLNRDRFILSNGHGSMLQYALLHLTGYDLSLEDLKNFRQLNSKTPGHPEVNRTSGIETTTGPLGQGLANGVGMALAQKILAAQFNREKFKILDHRVYVFLGDGCLMEGISHEACSLAGTWKLGKLIAFWDDNRISIDGDINHWLTDDTIKRFDSYGWQVIAGVDGHDAEAIRAAIEAAKTESEKPTLICCRTTIGFGSPNKSGKAASHGAPLGEEEIKETRQALNWSHPPFEIPKTIYETYDATEKGAAYEKVWQELFDEYQKVYPDLAKEFLRRMQGELPKDFHESLEKLIHTWNENLEDLETRKASKKILDHIGLILPELLGGSADLSGSNATLWNGCRELLSNDFDVNYIHYGVREFGMSAIMNGMSLYGGLIPYGGTFLVFCTYAINAVRMAALMKKRVIFVYSHDSIGVGEDGPTHQPIEQLAMLRSIPRLMVWRPADRVESAVAWQMMVERDDGPSVLVTTRQPVEQLPRTAEMLGNIRRGGCIIFDCEGTPNGIIMATGSEVPLAVEAAKTLAEKGQKIRVVSVPCMDLFLQQDVDYREAVLPKAVTKRVAVEAGITQNWHQWVGEQGRIIGLDQFGLSAPTHVLFEKFGFTAKHIAEVFLGLIGEHDDN